YRATAEEYFLEEASARGRYLLRNLEQLTRQRGYDGMIAYTLLRLYEHTSLPEFFQAGDQSVRNLMHLRASPSRSTNAFRPNVCLLAGMPYAPHSRRRGERAVLRGLQSTLATLPVDQRPNGAFPHAFMTRELTMDLHYSSWMAM